MSEIKDNSNQQRKEEVLQAGASSEQINQGVQNYNHNENSQKSTKTKNTVNSTKLIKKSGSQKVDLSNDMKDLSLQESQNDPSSSISNNSIKSNKDKANNNYIKKSESSSSTKSKSKKSNSYRLAKQNSNNNSNSMKPLNQSGNAVPDTQSENNEKTFESGDHVDEYRNNNNQNQHLNDNDRKPKSHKRSNSKQGSYIDIEQNNNHFNFNYHNHNSYNNGNNTSFMKYKDEDGNIIEGEQEPTRILWVGNIGKNISESDIINKFSSFGKLESIRILHDRFCAFVNFVETEAAKQAKETLHGSNFGSQNIVINYRKVPPTKSFGDGENANPYDFDENGQIILNAPSNALWIGNIGENLEEEELTKEFQVFGQITSVRLLKQKTCAFVNFAREEDAINALQTLQGKVIGTMPLKINYGKPQNNSKQSKYQQPQQQQQPISPSSPHLSHHNNIYSNQSIYNQQHQQYQYYQHQHNNHYNNPTNQASYMIPHNSPYYTYLQMLSAMHQQQQSIDPSIYQYYNSATIQQQIENTTHPCELCQKNLKDTIISPCNHWICNECANHLNNPTTISSSQTGGVSCPFCKQQVLKFSLIPSTSYPSNYHPYYFQQNQNQNQNLNHNHTSVHLASNTSNHNHDASSSSTSTSSSPSTTTSATNHNSESKIQKDNQPQLQTPNDNE